MAMWGWGCGENKSERHEGINWTKGETNRFMWEEDACGMVKHFAFVEVQIKRQEKSARNE